SAKAEAISILEENEVFGIFPEGTRNELSCKEELIDKYYKIYDKEYTRKEFKKIIKKNRVRISQVNLLEELYNDKKIDYNFYKKYVINAKKGLKHLVEDNIITLEEYNDSLLLPLKFGAVSMAKKTDSVIVPFASNGEYKLFGKRPKVKIGEGFKVSDMSLEDANNKLRKEIISLLVDILD
ncbi:MAG: 1-acyl-sn-glycerol-3-phosphate acyltransferase, partial [Clostridium sp.]|nr:1-acyl-sn-glycerol-3-phosphate acyltransferase [Clostridium sp.]